MPQDHKFSINKYEVKFFLKINKVLDTMNNLEGCVKDAFKISNDDFERIDIQFIDTKEHDNYKNGWILRNRKKENKDYYELTYKKRYTVDGDIDTTLQQVQFDGFTSDKFEVQIDWELKKQKISVSPKEKIEISEDQITISNSNLPDITELHRIFLLNAPEIFLSWQGENWGENQIQDSKIYGPVYAKKYTGKWENTEVNLEIWTLEDEPESIIEISFKSKDKNEAHQLRNKLKELLSARKWLSKKDISKTKWVMEHSK
ncbi:hypothetical protein [Bacillus wiedmannii]|uniref:hypothetical protein n=1 Tax=Bacillus wiedmannii TaxID=1890302 RepID=UPI0025A20BBE|nr:hypothetical protein [Bacillus wiedmannii]MDM5264966.1 hypothetical protein [Bacillus wiedmannii]